MTVKLAANLSMMFTEEPFLARFAAAAHHGFKGVEYLFPYDFPAEDISRELREHQLENVLFNLPPGNWDEGERGLTGLPGRETEFLESLEKALEYAAMVGCRQLHVMYGIPPSGASLAACEQCYIANLQMAAKRAEKQQITLLIEPLNPRDVPGYPLMSQAKAHELVSRIGAENVQVQFDLYHCQIMEGDMARKIRQYAGRFKHVQIAGVPERHEPNRGEIHYPYLLALLDETGYTGWVGCEYSPAGTTASGLGWAAPYGIRS